MKTRAHIHAPRHVGDILSDAVVAGMGSWRFIIIQSAIVALWVISNVWLLTHPFDPFPLILLNLVFSTQAAYASPLILMSQNRQATKDRLRDDVEATEVSEAAQRLLVQEQRVLDLAQHLDKQDDLILQVVQRQEAQHHELLAKVSQLSTERRKKDVY